MQSWPSPPLPRLPRSGGIPRLSLHDTASGTVRDPLVPGEQPTMYVCGITPYDATHLGHAATYVTFDLINRFWRDAGHQVRYTQNVTDVDDPLLERAEQTQVSWKVLAETEIELFREDMTALRVLPPDDYVGAVESIQLVTELIEQLGTAGAVYPVDDDLYFAVHADAGFGKISGYPVDIMQKLFAERGGDPDRPRKRDPLDCLLWQAERPAEPAWDSPQGRGRPGWHIECSAIALHHLGNPITLSGGGTDLIFPHHEMSASQAQVATGHRPFARSYVHSAMVGLDGEKMSKSRGNLVLVSQQRRAGVDPLALRLSLLAHSYRHDWGWEDAGLRAAEQRLAGWRAAAGRPAGPDAAALLATVRTALADDLDTPAALRAVDTWCAADGEHSDAPELMRRTCDGLLGVPL